MRPTGVTPAGSSRLQGSFSRHDQVPSESALPPDLGLVHFKRFWLGLRGAATMSNHSMPESTAGTSQNGGFWCSRLPVASPGSAFGHATIVTFVGCGIVRVLQVAGVVPPCLQRVQDAVSVVAVSAGGEQAAGVAEELARCAVRAGALRGGWRRPGLRRVRPCCRGRREDGQRRRSPGARPEARASPRTRGETPRRSGVRQWRRTRRREGLSGMRDRALVERR